MFTLTGTLADHGGQPLAATTLIIQPTPAVTLDPAGKVVHLEGREVATDEAGSFTVDLVAADGLTYTVRSTAGGRLRPQRFTAPADGATVDLADVTAAHAPSPMVEYVRGASAYEVWLAQGNTGTVEDYHASLRGRDGTATINATPNGNGTTTLTGVSTDG